MGTVEHDGNGLASVLQQYGAIPWRLTKRGTLKVLLVTSRTSRHWLVPKGWPMAGKTPAEVAEQEAFEEAGVFGDVSNRPLASYGTCREMRDGTEVACLVTLFGLRVRATFVDWPEKHERQRRWMAPEEAAQVMADKNLAATIARLELDAVLGRHAPGTAQRLN